jgi:hypothetical protein
MILPSDRPAPRLDATTIPALSSGDQRRAHRVKLEPGRARIALGGHWHELRDVSATGGSLAMPAGMTIAGQLSATIHLPDEPAFQATFRVMRTHADERGQQSAGAHFVPLEPEALRSLSRFVIREYLGQSFDLKRLKTQPAVRTRDPKAIANLLEALAVREGAVVQVFERSTPLPVQLALTRIVGQPAQEIEAQFLGLDRRLAPGVEYNFLLSGRASVLLFSATLTAHEGGRVRLSFPRKLLQTGFRASHRTPVSPDVGLTASFSLPWSPARIARPVCNVSARGLSIDLDVERHTLFPGDRLHGLQIDLPAGPIFAKGAIKSLATVSRKTMRCGVEIVDFESDADRRRWHGFVFAHAHPRIRRTDVILDDVWNVFESSTYLDKWITSGRSHEIRALFDRDWNLSDEQNGELLLLKQNDQAIGTIAANQIYPRTWLMHSLAVDKSHRQKADRERFLDLARELYSGINYSLQHISGSRYFVAYFEETKNWNQLLYRDFARDYVASADQLYESFHVLRKAAAAQPASDSAGAAAVTVTLADPDDLQLVARRAGETLPAMVVDALALSDAEIDLEAFRDAGNGLKRRRDVFIAREDGRPVIAAICEAGGEGINIFGLLNLCWTIPLVDDEPAASTYRALVDAVAAHYLEQGVPDFLFLEAKAERVGSLQSAGLELVSAGIRWLARVDVLPAWLGYVENELSALTPSRPPVV